MKVLMTGGGTGGHANPAIAIANTIRENQPDAIIEFVGTSRGIENKLVPAEGYKLHHVEVQGFKRRLTPYNIKSAWLAFTSPIKAKKLIRDFRPDLVIGTGGYVCWPLLKAAASMGIPTAVHESNAYPGVAVKMLARYVDRIYTTFDATADNLGDEYREKILKVGNPVKTAFTSLGRAEARRVLGIEGRYKYFLLSCGGSMGAEKVNDEMLAFMRDYTKDHPELLHVHATGAIEYEAATAKFREYGLEGCENIKLLEYIYDMPQQMAAADIVVSRAGSMSLSELAMLGKCAVLIPSPHVTENHQYKNARVLADRNAALLFEEKELTDGRLTDALAALLADDAKRAAMENNVKAFALTDANKSIYFDLLRLVSEKKAKS
ncbi:MAG: undecaprenyldiphospho-muramoylpentapeptide beta-N-acetylglucosaminyltransferase [Ruminococcaceae bacterium]|nr:undecaprenyldiphospho-muramoylpentapeptide beta-N-acetylglucosaminyltransferase [Oscillospiraceae bacterium]